MNVNCATTTINNNCQTTTTGAEGRGRSAINSDGQFRSMVATEMNHWSDQGNQQTTQYGQKRHRSGGQAPQLAQLPASSTSSTMQSTAAIIATDNDRSNMKANDKSGGSPGGGGKGHYNNSSTMEMYFSWFSAITFILELAIDISLAAFYFHGGHQEWAIITLAIVLVPLVLCQIYSVVLMRSDQHYTKGQPVLPPILWHICLMGLPYRYFDLFKRVDHLPSHEVRYKLQEIQAIQTINAILQYCPQCIFQVFIIVHRNYACLFTGITAGLAGFSFAWHLFLQCYSLAQRSHDDYKITPGPNFSSNLRVNNLENNSSSLATILTSTSSTSIAMDDHHPGGAVNYNPSASHSLAEEALALRKNLQILEKTSSMDNRNLVPKESKNVDKVKIFQFNKRRPIYQGDDLDFIDRIDRLDDSEVLQNKSTIYYEMTAEEDEDDLQKPRNNGAVSGYDCNLVPGDPNSMPRLKRKGICSSQEMLHLVDLMNENISADQIDTLEKSLLDLNGMEAAIGDLGQQQQVKPSSGSVVMSDEKSVAGSRGSEGDGESANIFKGFPESLDESTQSSILENIDAAIYENQIIFQERIRKNQLTIQNLKLQDQLLSQFMELSANGLPNNANLQAILMSLEEQRRQAIEAFGKQHHQTVDEDEMGINSGDPNTSMGYLSTRDYENMCYVNITRNVNKLKHWRNYVQNIQGNQHDASTAMNSSCFGNTTTTTTATSTDLAEAKVDDLYMVMQPANKNILVETINQINDTSSPMKHQQQQHQQQQAKNRPMLNAGGGGGVEFDCGIAGDMPVSGYSKMRKEGGKQVPGLYFYNLNNIPLDSILESNCEDN